LNTLHSKDAKEVKGKRQKVSGEELVPIGGLNVSGGVMKLKWVAPETIIVGSGDHTLKKVDVEKN